MESRRIEIDGCTYQLRPWAYKAGRKWLFRLSKLMLGAAGTGGSKGDQTVAASVILEDVDLATFEDFADTCIEYTDVVEGDRVVPLKAIAAAHLVGRHYTLVALMKAHVEEEFADFFGRLPALLGADRKPDK